MKTLYNIAAYEIVASIVPFMFPKTMMTLKPSINVRINLRVFKKEMHGSSILLTILANLHEQYSQYFSYPADYKKSLFYYLFRMSRIESYHKSECSRLCSKNTSRYRSIQHDRGLPVIYTIYN